MRHFAATTLVLCALTMGSATAADNGTPTANPPRLGIVIEVDAFDASQGLPIKSVVPGSTAAAMGLQPGDLLVSINGTAISSDKVVGQALTGLTPGHPLKVEVRRRGELTTLEGELQAAPTAANLLSELGDVRGQINDIKAAVDARTREPTLAELLRELQILQDQFPRAAAEFKKLYPNGEFSIVIRITSDKNAKEPVDLLNIPPLPNAQMPPTEVPAP